MNRYISRPIIVEAGQYSKESKLPNFRKHTDPPLSFYAGGHGVFDKYKNGEGVIIVPVGDWVVYFESGEIKTYKDDQFRFMFSLDVVRNAVIEILPIPKI